MSMTGQLYRVSAERLQQLLNDPDQIQSELYPDNYPENHEQYGCDVEKTWDAIQFVLDRLAENKRIGIIEPIMGGQETDCVLDYGPVRYLTTEKVAETARELNKVTRAMFCEGFQPDKMSERKVYPEVWDEGDDRGLQYVWQYFQDLVHFYRTAAERREAVLLYLA